MRAATIVALLMAGSASADAVAGPPDPDRRIVLFGARWCGPCMVEYRSLPAIVAAAMPDRVVLAWIDRPIAVPAGLGGKAEAVSVMEAQRLARRALGEGYGLPSSVMLDAYGNACSLWRAPLRPVDVKHLRDDCHS